MEVRETITRHTTKPDGLRPGDCYHEGLTVLSCSVTRDNRGNSPYSQHVPFFTHLNNEHCDELCCAVALRCMTVLCPLCLVHAWATNNHRHDGPTVRAVAH